MATGIVKYFTGERGFGFIRPDAGGADVFFHVSAIAEGDDPAVGQAVTFEIGVDARSGKPKAVNVEIV